MDIIIKQEIEAIQKQGFDVRQDIYRVTMAGNVKQLICENQTLILSAISFAGNMKPADLEYILQQSNPAIALFSESANVDVPLRYAETAINTVLREYAEIAILDKANSQLMPETSPLFPIYLTFVRLSKVPKSKTL